MSPTAAEAGTDQTVCTTTATLNGNTPTIGTGTWTVISGTASVTNSTSPTSGVTGLGSGANTFRWTINNSPCTASSDEVIIDYNSSPACVTALPNIIALEEFKIMPNPNNGIFTVLIKLNTIKKVRFRIFNLMSQLVYLSESYQISGQQYKIIDGSKLAAGLYLLETTIGTETFNQKIIIAR